MSVWGQQGMGEHPPHGHAHQAHAHVHEHARSLEGRESSRELSQDAVPGGEAKVWGVAMCVRASPEGGPESVGMYLHLQSGGGWLHAQKEHRAASFQACASM